MRIMPLASLNTTVLCVGLVREVRNNTARAVQEIEGGYQLGLGLVEPVANNFLLRVAFLRSAQTKCELQRPRESRPFSLSASARIRMNYAVVREKGKRSHRLLEESYEYGQRQCGGRVPTVAALGAPVTEAGAGPFVFSSI